ncbi:MAG: efflux RND transporter periplasmic adaptor subunit [Oscillospiraceae bacterium]
MKKKIRVAIVMGFILSMMSMFTGCNGENSTDMSVNGTYFENVMPYQAQNLSDYISVSGTVQSESSMNVTSSVSSKITKLNVSVGDYVNVGDVLCVMDTSDIQKQITDLEKSIKNASALDENTKELNRKALQNAKEDQKIQLDNAQDVIDEAQKTYDKTYKKYTDKLNEINKLVQQYNDISQQITNYEISMNDSPIDDDYYYDDTIPSDDTYFDDELLDIGEDMSFNPNMNSYQFNDLSYNNGDDYSSLVAKREEISAKIESYKSECEVYEEQFDSLKKAIEDAKDSYNSVKRSTDQAIDSAQNTVDMQDYQDGDNSASNQLEDLKQQLADCTVKAEKSGTITSLVVAQGDTLTQGALIMTIENNSKLKITVNIDEGDILKVKEGMRVVITSEATGETEINGTVSKVITVISSNGDNNVQSQQGLTSSGGFTAEITIDDNSELLVGMKAKAKIILVEKTGCYSVLYDCIMYDDNGNPYVFVADTSNSEDGTTAIIKRADVTLGEESGSYVEVNSDNLSENDLIITTPYDVTEGDTIQLSPYALDFGTSEDTDNNANIEVVD